MKTEQQWLRTTRSLSNLEIAALRKSFEYQRRHGKLVEYLNVEMPSKIFWLIHSEILKVYAQHEATWALYNNFGEKLSAALKEPFSYTWTRSDGATCEGVCGPNKEQVA